MSIFYNPGTPILEKLSFSHTNTDALEGYVTSYWDVNAKAEEFFEIPDTFKMPGVGGGIVEVSLRSVIDKARTQYRERGVVLVQALPKAPEGEDAPEYGDDDNIAETKAEAKTKGARLWKAFMYAKAMEHYATVEENKARGVPSRPATNLFKHALRVMGMEDPANQVETITRVKAEAASSDAMAKEIQELRDQLNQVLGAQRAQQPAEPAKKAA